MTDKQATEKYFRDLNDMFNSDGWKHLIEELKVNAMNVNSVELTKDSDDLMFRKGQLAIIANILNLPATVEQAQAEFESGDEDETA